MLITFDLNEHTKSITNLFDSKIGTPFKGMHKLSSVRLEPMCCQLIRTIYKTNVTSTLNSKEKQVL
jgi:hypothetical protein